MDSQLLHRLIVNTVLFHKMTGLPWTVSYCTNSQHGIVPQSDLDVLDSQLLQSLTQSTPNIYNDIDMPLVVRIESFPSSLPSL